MNVNSKMINPPGMVMEHGGGMSSQSNRQSLNMNPYQNQHKSVPNSMIQSSNNSPVSNSRGG
jgi:hypothetical protein